MTPGSELPVTHCRDCDTRFLPRVGPCPACGSDAIEAAAVPAEGTVLAATELRAPAEGWTDPHPLVLVELGASVRLLAIGEGPLPRPGDPIRVRTENGRWFAGPRV